MLSGEGVICGTSTTGTGTLTLAAVPEPPGGADFYQWLTATGIGFVNGNAVLVPYTIVEYTSSSFGTEKSREVGVGTLTLGASLTGCTLARTTVQMKATSLDSPPAIYTIAAPTAFSIATAANVLVFVGPNAANVPQFSPYFENTTGDTVGVSPFLTNTATSSVNLANGTDRYQLFFWPVPMLAKRITARVATAYTGGTTNLYARIYGIASTGRPGKLLYDFGVLGTAGTSLNTALLNIQSGASGNGYFLAPGIYFIDFLSTFTGGSGTPALTTNNTAFYPGCLGTTNLTPGASSTATSGNATAPDPANTTAYAIVTTTTTQIMFTLKDS